MPISAHTKRIAIRLAAYFVIGVAAAVAFDLLALQGVLAASPIVLIIAAGMVAAVVIGGAGLYISALDDRQRVLRYTCWYWGGLFGLLFGFLTIVAALRTGLYSELFPNQRIPGGVLTGALAVAVAQLAGYYGARLVWWIKYRAPRHEE